MMLISGPAHMAADTLSATADLIDRSANKRVALFLVKIKQASVGGRIFFACVPISREKEVVKLFEYWLGNMHHSHNTL